MEKQQAMPKKTVKGLKIKQHIPLQMWTQSTMKQCVSAISSPERGGWVDSLPIILFPEQTEQTLATVVLRTSVQLSPSVLSLDLFFFCYDKATNNG